MTTIYIKNRLPSLKTLEKDSVRDHVQVRAKRQANASVRMSSLYSHSKEKRLKWDPMTHEGLLKDTYKCQGCNEFSTSR